MAKVAALALTLFLAGCALARIGSVTDRYGNYYGGWYNPGQNYTWQLDTCERQMEQRDTPVELRKLAMRCCMYAHGVPIGDPRDCAG